MAIPVGFRTDNARGSLYAIDAQNRITRHCLTGHSNHGDVEAPSRAIYLAENQREILQRHLHDKNSQVRLVYMDKQTRLRHVWQGDDTVIPADNQPGIVVFDRRSGNEIESWPASAVPAKGLTPFDMSFERKPNGDLFATRHMGHPIHQVYESRAEFDAELKKAGFTPFFMEPVAPKLAAPVRRDPANPAP